MNVLRDFNIYEATLSKAFAKSSSLAQDSKTKHKRGQRNLMLNTTSF